MSRMYLQPPSLIAGAQDYVSNATLPTAALPVQFQVLLSGTTYSASVTLPAPYQITSPTTSTVVPLSAPTLSVQLTATSLQAIDLTNGITLDCTDSNGNTGTGTSAGTLVAGSLSSTASGSSYSLDLGPSLNTLNFSTTYARGTITSCTGTLSLTMQSTGQGDSRMASTQIIGQQIRKASFTIR